MIEKYIRYAEHPSMEGPVRIFITTVVEERSGYFILFFRIYPGSHAQLNCISSPVQIHLSEDEDPDMYVFFHDSING